MTVIKRGNRGADVVQLQRTLVNYGYRLTPDGVFGALTESAVRDFQQRQGLSVDGVVGSKTQTVLATAGTATPPRNQNSRAIEDLHMAIQQAASDFLARANVALKQVDAGLEVKFISTYRSQAEQDKLYAQGRTKPGQVVTWVRTSAHNTDLPETPTGDSEAFDIGVFDRGRYLTGANTRELDLYRKLGPIGEALGLTWGGRWKTPDYPHYERTGWREKR